MTKHTPEPIKLPPLQHTEAETKLLHRIGGTAGAVLQADPEWSRAARGLVAVAEASAQLAEIPADPVRDLADALAEAALNGDPIDLLERTAEHAARANTRDFAVRALRSAQSQLETDLTHSAQAAVPRMFEAIASELTRVWAELRGVAEVGRMTAERAIAADRAAEWRQWADLLDRHAELRREQSVLVKRAGVASPYPEALVLRDVDAVFPAWAFYQLHGSQLVHEDGETEHVAPPWPLDPHGRLTLSTAAEPEFVTWALEADVMPWCPTPAELRDETARLAGVLTTGHRPMTRTGRARERATVAAAMTDGQ